MAPRYWVKPLERSVPAVSVAAPAAASAPFETLATITKHSAAEIANPATAVASPRGIDRQVSYTGDIVNCEFQLVGGKT